MKRGHLRWWAEVVVEKLVASSGCMYYRALQIAPQRSWAGTHTDSGPKTEQNLISSQVRCSYKKEYNSCTSVLGSYERTYSTVSLLWSCMQAVFVMDLLQNPVEIFYIRNSSVTTHDAVVFILQIPGKRSNYDFSTKWFAWAITKPNKTLTRLSSQKRPGRFEDQLQGDQAA